jgi:hypothetical protein
VEASEIAETIHGRRQAHSAEADAAFRKSTRIYLGIIAMLPAIAALAGSHAAKTMLGANIHQAFFICWRRTMRSRKDS